MKNKYFDSNNFDFQFQIKKILKTRIIKIFNKSKINRGLKLFEKKGKQYFIN